MRFTAIISFLLIGLLLALGFYLLACFVTCGRKIVSVVEYVVVKDRKRKNIRRSNI